MKSADADHLLERGPLRAVETKEVRPRGEDRAVIGLVVDYGSTWLSCDVTGPVPLVASSAVGLRERVMSAATAM